jgi:ferredoxin/flavodoxin---NADP+ reductase
MSHETETADRYDITIIGGGPTALFGAFYAGIRQMKVKIVDSLPELGGQLSALYPEKLIFDMPGYPQVLARDLVSDMVEQAMKSSPEVCLEERILAMDHVTPEWIAVTSNRGVHITRTVLIAAGIGSFSPRNVSVPGIEKYMDRHIHYAVRDIERFRGKKVLIVGGGDSACDWAMGLLDVAEHVTLIHRRDVFRAHEESVSQLLDSDTEVRLFRTLKEVRGTDGLESVVVENTRDGIDEELDVDEVLLAIGFTASLGPILDWNLQIESKKKIRVDSTMATNLPGVYAAGDIVTYPGKLDLIATGVAEAATAVNNAKHYIDPTAKVQPGHSSDLDKSVVNVKIPEDRTG